jgi:hypothetical protein
VLGAAGASNTPPPRRHSLPWRSCTTEESEVESCEHQDNANIYYQPFPESLSEEQEIHTHYNGCHRHHVKHDSYLSAHVSKPRFWLGFTKRLINGPRTSGVPLTQ